MRARPRAAGQGASCASRPGAQPVFSYRVRTEEGGVRLERRLRAASRRSLFKLAKLTRDVAKGPCHLAR